MTQLKAKKRRSYQPVVRVEDERGRTMVGTIMYQTTADSRTPRSTVTESATDGVYGSSNLTLVRRLIQCC